MTGATAIANFLRTERRRRGWTQQELADRLHIKRETLSWWERGRTKKPPSYETATTLAHLFGREVEDVLRLWGYPLGEGPSEEVDRLNTEEREAVLLLRTLPPSQRELQLSALRALTETLHRQGERGSEDHSQ